MEDNQISLIYFSEDTVPSKWSFYYIINLFLTLLCAVTTFAMIYVTVLIRRKTDDEHTIPVMLVFLILALISKYSAFLWWPKIGGVMYFSWTMIRSYSHPYTDDQFDWHKQCEMTVYPFLMDVFLLPAVILNISKWIYFRLRVERQVQVERSIDF